ncbi:MAG TPA: hypothetical protein DCZ94_05990 [Lentisphaeria bacterium]|nr:MAG: hypothetical protein A2X48_07500 [Lentisphaerae bacterium GWF2_49_21]HBC86487.1 hypothetical protein [Lentisphaeria bacterium]
MRKVLVADDDPGVRTLISAIIRRKGEFLITETSSLAEASYLCTENKFDLIFLDHNLNDGIGWEVAEMISLDPRKYGNPMIVAMSGSVPQERATKCGVHYSQFMPKPFDVAQIKGILEKLPKESSNGK